MKLHLIIMPIVSVVCLTAAQTSNITGQLTLFTRAGQTVVRVELRTQGQVTGEKEREIRSILENIADRFQRKPGIPLERTGGEIHIDRYYTLRDADHTDFYQLAGHFRGRKVLLYFYPKADTPGCTTQACSIRDSRENLSVSGVAALGISPDLPEKQAKFDVKHTLGFPLLSDPDHAVAEAYGAWGEKSMYGKKYMGIFRSSFLIDEDGRVMN